MQVKWEYKLVVRYRGFGADESKKNAPWKIARDWDVDMEEMLPALGDEGWELVAITSRSNYLGGVTETSFNQSVLSKDYAGFTNNELWVFKRPKK